MAAIGWFIVAPHTGAWIETPSFVKSATAVVVAPHTGAWIETGKTLKVVADLVVAPHTGAWIETFIISVPSVRYSSHPTRVRGLKLDPANNAVKYRVAPHTGAWIETAEQV